MNWIYGGDGKDLITGGDWVNVIFGKKGNDIIDTRQSFFSYIEGGEGDDTINGPTNPWAIGSIIFGDDLSIGNLNPIEHLELGVSVEWGKSIGVKLGASIFKFDGNGNDTIDAGNGFINAVFGGEGNDTITVGGKLNVVLGDEFNLAADLDWEFDLSKWETKKFEYNLPGLFGHGNDTVHALGWANFVATGDGNDTVDGGSSNVVDVFYGGGGTDLITGGAGFDFLIGGDGDDTLTGGDFANIILGDEFAAGSNGAFPLPNIQALFEGKLVGGIGLLPYGSGKDSITGGNGLDLIIGGAEVDTINAKDGLNVVFGDEISLGLGFAVDFKSIINDTDNATKVFKPLTLSGDWNDTITGGSGSDVVFGGGGDDLISTGAGDFDLVFGGDGKDTINGGSGFNALIGGDGSDLITGGNDGNVIWGDGFTIVGSAIYRTHRTAIQPETPDFRHRLEAGSRLRASRDRERYHSRRERAGCHRGRRRKRPDRRGRRAQPGVRRCVPGDRHGQHRPRKPVRDRQNHHHRDPTHLTD